MKISILGLGYLGLPLAESLLKEGHEVLGSSRSPRSSEVPCEPLRSPELPSSSLLQCDVLVLNIPPFPGQPEWFASWDYTRTRKLIFVSSTGAPKNEILLWEEDWVKANFQDWLILRPGGLLGRGRHPGKILSGRRELKGGEHPVNLIHVDDLIGFIQRAIALDLKHDTISVVSDEHSSRREFYGEYCRRNGLLLPEFDPGDKSEGPVVSNEALKRYYELKFPRLIGRAL